MSKFFYLILILLYLIPLYRLFKIETIKFPRVYMVIIGYEFLTILGLLDIYQMAGPDWKFSLMNLVYVILYGAISAPKIEVCD